MLLRYFDQKVQKSRFTECGTIQVPFGTKVGTTKPIGTKIGTNTTYPIRNQNHLILKKSFKGQSIETQTVHSKEWQQTLVLILGNKELEDTKMLLRYFDQEVQKSRFNECGTSMVPFWYHLVPPSQLVPKLAHILLVLLE